MTRYFIWYIWDKGFCEYSEVFIIKATIKENGFEGILMPGDGKKDKVVIVISGSDGGMKFTKLSAEFYNKNGIPALALALFATKETGPFLDRVPIEYVKHAIFWLKKQGYERIGIDGMSKGSEMALIAASLFDELSCVIVRVPSYFISEGLIGCKQNKRPSGTSCWSYNGVELPFAPYNIRKFNIFKIFMEEKEIHSITFNKDKKITPECMIHFENIKAPVLIISSKKDTIWPSYDYALYMERIFKEIRFSFKYRHIAYDNMSHLALTRIPSIYKLFFKSERNNIVCCKKERDNMKNELLNWVNNVW